MCVLERPDEQVYETWDGAVFPERGVVCGAECQVPDQADDRLDQGPPRGRVHEADDGGKTALETHSVLRHFALWVAGCQVAQGAHRRLRNLLPMDRKEKKKIYKLLMLQVF